MCCCFLPCYAQYPGYNTHLSTLLDVCIDEYVDQTMPSFRHIVFFTSTVNLISYEIVNTSLTQAYVNLLGI